MKAQGPLTGLLSFSLAPFEETTMPEPSNAPRSNVNRRSVLAAVIGVGGALATTVAGLAGGFLANALGRAKRHDWIRVGPAEDLDAENFQKLVLSEDHEHAWVRERKALVVYIKDYYPDGDPVALHARCSHLGCSVKWNPEKSHFKCPCHGGTFSEAGEVVAGPPPRALTRLEVKIEELDNEEICFVRLPSEEDKA